ncbi:MAG: hypothetical protein KIT35_18055 [Piscinibacter sp.]|uniref:hypothetical protein n=1 Tax=Piscinibacter sp. TaxID=1903157 RepID=UPI00258AA988|nr:hypothetical protein [Piscinibacter sp.]MCW5665737.1 hypothetical protein [Piscinibacter sp.]
MTTLCRLVAWGLALLLAACGDRAAAPPAPAASAASSQARAQADALVALLRGAEIQAETDAQRAELRRALQDLRDRPLAELQGARYAGPDGTPGQRGLADLLRAHLVPAQPAAIELEALVAARAVPEARALLDETIARIGAAAK